MTTALALDIALTALILLALLINLRRALRPLTDHASNRCHVARSTTPVTANPPAA